MSKPSRAAKLTTVLLTVLLAFPILPISPAAAAPGNGWGIPSNIPGVNGRDSSFSTGPAQMAGDRDGNVFVVYPMNNVTNWLIVANRYVPSIGWTGPKAISNLSLSSDNFASIATDPYGNAFAFWTGSNGTFSTFHYAFYTVLGGWQPTQQIPVNGTTYAPVARVAMDGLGNGYFAFQYYNGTAYEHHVGRVTMDGVVYPPERIPFVDPAYDLAIAGSPTGGAMALSLLYTSVNNTYILAATRYALGVGWLPPVAIVERTVNYITTPAVGFDDSGQARMVWYNSVNSYYVWTATWSAARGHGAAEGAISWNQYMAVAKSVFLPNGVVVVAHFSYNYTTSRYCITYSRFIPGMGWSQPGPCTTFTGNPHSTMEVTSDATGNGVIVYRNTADGRAYGVEFTSAGISASSLVLTSAEATAVAALQIASTGHGRALVNVGYNPGGFYQNRENEYKGIDTAAPWASLDRPLNGHSTSDGFVAVTGWAEPGAQVTVNGARAVTYPNGTFRATVPLSEGMNELQATAVDADGNSATSPNVRWVWQTNLGPILDAERRNAGTTGFQTAVRFDNVSFGSAWDVSVESDGVGNAWAMWYEWTGHYLWYVARYVNGTGWSAPLQIRHANDMNIFNHPEMVVDSAGNMMVLWNEYNTSGYLSLWARIWLVSGGWQADMRLDNTTTWAYQLSAAATAGRFIASWRQDESPQPQVYAMEYRVVGGWQNRTRVSTPGVVSHVPGITYNSTGYAQLVFATREGSIDTWVIANMTPAGVWSNYSQLQNLSTSTGGQPEIRAGLGSNFTVTWTQVNGSLRDTRAGRFMNGTWQGSELLMGNTWDWASEIVVDAQGYSYVVMTESQSGVANAWAWVSRPGQPFDAGTMMDNGTLWGGGPRVSPSFNRQTASVWWDEQEGGMSRANMRTFNKATNTWGPVVRVLPDSGTANIPDGVGLPDGGWMIVYCRFDPIFNGYQIDGTRYVPPETIAPALTVTTPTNGFLTTSSSMRVQGTTESGALVTINGVVAAVAPNGSFALDLALVNGTNAIYITARDAAGNMNATWRNGTFDDPDRRRIETVEAQNAALNAALNATNAALAAQNATLLGQIANLNASLLAQLAAQNTSLLNAIGSLNASVLAQLAAQNASLLNLIAQTNAGLLAQMAAQNSSLLNLIAQTNSSLLAALAAGDASLAALIASTNASLLASLAAQNSALLSAIAQTNATLFAQLAAQNSALLDALADQNASLLAQMAAEDQVLAALIADTNADLLAQLAAQNASLLDALAQQDAALLASLAAQNSALLATIAVTNASLLANLAATNASLYAQLTAGDGAVWAALNSSAAAQQANLAGTQSGLQTTNSSLSDTQDDVARVDQAAANAALMGTLGLILGLAGVGVAVMSIMMSRRGGHPPSGGESLRAPPPTPGGAHPVDAEVVSSGGSSHGHSMAAESELGGSEENQ